MSVDQAPAVKHLGSRWLPEDVRYALTPEVYQIVAS
jgi:hypothetical protein